MRIRLTSGLILGQAPYQIQTIDGLETPAIRNSNAVYAGADGGYMISQYYGHRTITIKGFFHGCVSDLRQELLSRLYMRYYSKITIEDFNGDCWIIEGYVSDIKTQLKSPKVGEYQLTLICPDPLLHPTESFLSESPTIIEEELTVNGDTTILRHGDSDVCPIITLTGEFTNPVIILGDYAFGLNLTTDNSSIITIDMKNRTVKSNDGTSLAEYRLVDSRWLHLGLGANTITIETEDESDTGTAELTYSAGYRGI